AGSSPRPGVAGIGGPGVSPPEKPAKAISPAGDRSSHQALVLRPRARAVDRAGASPPPVPRAGPPRGGAPTAPRRSAPARGAWLGSITPPDPSRILDVDAARCAISTAGAELAIEGMLWCSATQKRR